MKPGRYEKLGDSNCTEWKALCLSCDMTLTFDCAGSGALVAPTRMRAQGWQMVGSRSAALWRCSTCSGTPPPAMAPRPGKVVTPTRAALPRVLGTGRARSSVKASDDEELNRIAQLRTMRYHEPCWHCGAARGCEHRE